MGSANANVLPDPVLATPIQSFPSSILGIHAFCMAVGCFNPLFISIKQLN